MSALPVSYTLGTFTLVFFKQYKYLGIYDLSSKQIAAIHNLTNGRKLSIVSGDLVIDTAPSTSLYKTSYDLTADGSVFLEDNAIIVGTGDPSNGVQLTAYPLDNSGTCPNVVLKWCSANNIEIKTACNNNSCTAADTHCKVVTDQDSAVLFT